MSLSDFAIRHHPFTLVVFLLLIALGYNAWSNIPRSEDPSFEAPAFRITALYPGADPLEVERQLTEPVEDAIAELENLEELSSSSGEGSVEIVAEFEAGIDLERKYEEVVREVGALRGAMPAGVAELRVAKIDPSRVNIAQIALVSDHASWSRLADLAEDLEDRLERIPGVRDPATWAYPRRELRVALDLQRLAAAGVPPGRVLEAIRDDNTSLPGGSVESGGRRFPLETSGSYAAVEQLRDTVVAARDGQLLRVRDVAEVAWDTGAEDYTARLDGRRAVFVTAQQRDQRNIFRTQADIAAALADFAAQLPAGVELLQPFDQSRNVARRLSQLGGDFVLAIALVAFTLLPLGLRAAGIVMISIPLSLATGLAALFFAGFSLNQLSIAGFVVALGLLVDDSIVVTENIARFLRLGYPRMQAALLATRQIALAVLGCTAALLFAFLPLLALPGGAGKFIRSLPAAVTLTVLASLLVSLTIIPFLASRLLPAHEPAHGNALLRRLQALIHRVYAPWLQRALRAPRLTALLAATAVLASFALLPVMGVSMFPKADTPQFLVQIALPRGAGLARTDAVLRQVEAELRGRPEVRHVLANLGRGNPRIYYNVFQQAPASHYAEAFVVLHAYDSRRTPQLADELRTVFDRIAGAEIVVREFENGPGMPAPIALRVLGADLERLRELAAVVEQALRDTPGTRNVGNPLRHNRIGLGLQLDAQRAGLLGVAPLELDRSVRLAVAGLPAGEFREADGDSHPIVLRAPMRGQPTLDALAGLHLAGAAESMVPLGQLAQLQLVESTPAIDRYDRERAVLLTAYTRSGYNTERVTAAALQRLRGTLTLPTGYRLEVGGEVESRQDSFAGFGSAILVACFGILAVLVLEFGSFKSTLIVASVVPLGIMGGILALFLSGNSLSFTAIIGFIALIGIEIKNSILLVDFTNRLRSEGRELDAAIAEAGEVRFLPILLTSATAIGGMLPLALQDSPLYSPLAWAIIGGLVSSTLLGRLLTPVMYKLLPPSLHGTASMPSTFASPTESTP